MFILRLLLTEPIIHFSQNDQKVKDNGPLWNKVRQCNKSSGEQEGSNLFRTRVYAVYRLSTLASGHMSTLVYAPHDKCPNMLCWPWLYALYLGLSTSTLPSLVHKASISISRMVSQSSLSHGDALGSALLSAGDTADTFTHLAMATPSHHSLLPNLVDNVEQVTWTCVRSWPQS